ncbi:Protein kinase [Phytophthora palmivora]|uniref:Protein kinase n=1 Tax=Phytophthora palmivora TaxID=4796 RepID=A0A2P4X0R8_9STRA|nr:Protein kinase [Phytophthora palmivora]
MSHNYLWSVATNDALTPYTALVTFSNQIVNFSAAVFDPIMSTIQSMGRITDRITFRNFDSNLITSIPSTNFIALVKKLLTNICGYAQRLPQWQLQIRAQTTFFTAAFNVLRELFTTTRLEHVWHAVRFHLVHIRKKTEPRYACIVRTHPIWNPTGQCVKISSAMFYAGLRYRWESQFQG